MSAALRALALLAAANLAACAHAEPETPPSLDAASAAAIAAGRGAAAAGADVGRRIGRWASGPHLTEPRADVTMGPGPSLERTAPNSLWRAGARHFFNDQRAAQIGDILTVRIDIEDSAEVSNSTSRSRSGSTSAGVGSLFGKEEALGRLLPPGGNFDPGSLIDAEAQSQARGQGEISREERIELTVAAVVVDVLPNGNFIIDGRQEVRINSEVRDLTVAGVIRPEDIAADNTIRHTQIAEARIAYGGRGVLSTVQRPRWGQRVVDAISPW